MIFSPKKNTILAFTARLFKLIVLLAQRSYYTVMQISYVVDVQKQRIYRYPEFLKKLGCPTVTILHNRYFNVFKFWRLMLEIHPRAPEFFKRWRIKLISVTRAGIGLVYFDGLPSEIRVVSHTDLKNFGE